MVQILADEVKKLNESSPHFELNTKYDYIRHPVV